jgi:S-adenosylmethionine hydrolase
MGQIITFLTDFGDRDGYVAAMKGVVLTEAPDARIVDAAHGIPPQDVRAAAWVLMQYWRDFPQGTIHVAVVDPGVGTTRRILMVEADGRILLAPDNGLLTWVLVDANERRLAQVTPEVHRPGAPSNTFHGRDIFAYAAGRLAAGDPFDALSEPVQEPVCPDWAAVTSRGSRHTGEVVHIDHFGNAVTSVRDTHLRGADAAHVRVHVGSLHLRGLSRTYADVPDGEPLVLLGSTGHLEVSVSGGAAAAALGLSRGDVVVVETCGTTESS